MNSKINITWENILLSTVCLCDDRGFTRLANVCRITLLSYLQDQQCIYHLFFIILTDLLSPVFLIMSLIRVGGSNHASNTPFYVSSHRALSIWPGFTKKDDNPHRDRDTSYLWLVSVPYSRAHMENLHTVLTLVWPSRPLYSQRCGKSSCHWVILPPPEAESKVWTTLKHSG